MLVVIALFLGWLYTHMLLAEPLVSPYPFWIFPMFADTFIWNLEPRVLQTEGGNSVPGTSMYIDTYIYTYTYSLDGSPFIHNVYNHVYT